MEGHKFPMMSIVLTAAIGIASVASPARAAPGFLTGLAGSVCQGVQQTNFSKLSVPPNGAISNKSTTATAIINCPMAVEQGTNASFFVSYTKRDSQLLSCTLHRRNYDYLSGSTNTVSTTAINSFYLQVNGVANYLNSWQCTIPRNNGSGQNNVNGVFWVN
jgi:hypothetical protein